MQKMKLVKIDGFPVGWARMSEHDPEVILEMLIHESHAPSCSKHINFGVTDRSPNIQSEPQASGFYRYEGEDNRIFMRSHQGQWIEQWIDGKYEQTNWLTIARLLEIYTLVKI